MIWVYGGSEKLRQRSELNGRREPEHGKPRREYAAGLTHPGKVVLSRRGGVRRRQASRTGITALRLEKTEAY